MKKMVISILGVVMILSLAWMGSISLKNLDIRGATRNTQNDLSQMLNQLRQTDVDIASSTILIFFNSECEHCQWEMEEIGKNIDQFYQHRLMLTSFEPENEAISFLKNHGLSDYYVKSSPEKVMSSFSGGVPQTLIYRKGKLVRHFKGEVKIEAIIKVLESL